jgi:hypothetical protein
MGEGCGRSVDRDPADPEAQQIEIEGGESLRRSRLDRRDAPEPVLGRRVGDLEVVVIDLVAAVSLQREVGIADSRRARALRLGGRRQQQRSGDREGRAK